MTIEEKSRPRRGERIYAQTLSDGSGVLADLSRSTAYPITESGMRIWELCDGQHDVEAILDELEEHYDVDRAALKADSLRLLEDLLEKELLEITTAGSE